MRKVKILPKNLKMYMLAEYKRMPLSKNLATNAVSVGSEGKREKEREDL